MPADEDVSDATDLDEGLLPHEVGVEAVEFRRSRVDRSVELTTPKRRAAALFDFENGLSLAGLIGLTARS